MPGEVELWGSAAAGARKLARELVRARCCSAFCTQLPVAPEACFPELVWKGSNLLNMCRKGLDKHYARVLQRSAAMVPGELKLC